MGISIDCARTTSQYVENATPTSDGFMSAADKAKLDALMPGSSAVSRYIARAADYSNVTGVDSDVVSLTFPSSGGKDLLITASGNVGLASNESNATIQNLVDDFPEAHFDVYIDGVIVPHANATVLATPNLFLGTWDAIINTSLSITVRVSGLAAGNHTIAVKAALDIIPASGATLFILAASLPNAYCFNMECTEVG